LGRMICSVETSIKLLLAYHSRYLNPWPQNAYFNGHGLNRIRQSVCLLLDQEVSSCMWCQCCSSLSLKRMSARIKLVVIWNAATLDAQWDAAEPVRQSMIMTRPGTSPLCNDVV
jgi:hypothetical protein